MMTMELTSPSYTARDIENWANENQLNNEIASRLKKKYFTGSNQFHPTSRYTIVFTNNGGVVLKKDKTAKAS